VSSMGCNDSKEEEMGQGEAIEPVAALDRSAQRLDPLPNSYIRRWG
jgi:hypothetical protein